MIGVVDYGAGNLRSVQAALDRAGASWRNVAGPEDLAGLERLILPGVGHFGAAARRLRQAGLFAPLREFAASGAPFLGICLGMQLLFEGSEEEPREPGLGVLPGMVRRLDAPRLPHIGWTLVEPAAGAEGSILAAAPGPFFAYFAHTFAATADAAGTVAVATCPLPFAAAVRRGAAWGQQFHPEKSGGVGQAILLAFAGSIDPPRPGGEARRAGEAGP